MYSNQVNSYRSPIEVSLILFFFFFCKEGLESGDPGTDDGRFYFHLGDALQRMGDKDVRV